MYEMLKYKIINIKIKSKWKWKYSTASVEQK
jgi:hypothetical protein